MSNIIERAVDTYIDDKERNKKDDDKDSSSFPSDTVSMAGSVDDALLRLRDSYSKLKDRIKKDSVLAGEVEDLMEKEARHIIKPY